MRKRKWIIWVVSIFVLILIASAAYAAVTSIQNELQALSTVLIKNVDMTRVPNGVYAGQFSTLPVSAKVEVSVKGSKISDIKLIEHKNGQGKPAEVIIDFKTACCRQANPAFPNGLDRSCSSRSFFACRTSS